MSDIKVPTVEEVLTKLDDYILNTTNTPIDEHPPAIRSVYTRIRNYVIAMDLTKRIDPKVGAQQQRDLYNTFIMALNTDARVSFICLNILLFVYDSLKDSVFSERYAYRYIDRLELAGQQIRTFRYISHLFISTANPGTRRINLRRVDLMLVANSISIEIAKDNLVRYYNITGQ